MNRGVRTGEGGSLKFADLVAGNVFKKGDYWIFSKVDICGTDRIEVVKDCEVEWIWRTCLARFKSNNSQIVEIGPGTLTFAIPPGTLRYARKINQDKAQEAGSQGLVKCPDEEDVVRYTMSNIRMLEDKIVELDGRTPKADRNHNAWKAFRCQRDNQDLGSLLEVRQEHYVSKYSH